METEHRLANNHQYNCKVLKLWDIWIRGKNFTMSDLQLLHPEHFGRYSENVLLDVETESKILRI